jgi:hypothetical protein
MAKGIRLHRQFGVNPTMPVCFWCGKTRGEIALLGAAYKREAPMTMVIDYEPCETCQGQMALGIVAIQVYGTGGHKQPPLSRNEPGSVPTGRWAVLKRAAAQEMIGADIWPTIDKAGKMLLTIETWGHLGLPAG